MPSVITHSLQQLLGHLSQSGICSRLLQIGDRFTLACRWRERPSERAPKHAGYHGGGRLLEVLFGLESYESSSVVGSGPTCDLDCLGWTELGNQPLCIEESIDTMCHSALTLCSPRRKIEMAGKHTTPESACPISFLSPMTRVWRRIASIDWIASLESTMSASRLRGASFQTRGPTIPTSGSDSDTSPQSRATAPSFTIRIEKLMPALSFSKSLCSCYWGHDSLSPKNENLTDTDFGIVYCSRLIVLR